MLFGVLSAIALGIGVTATAQDLVNEDLAVPQDEPVVQIQEIHQEAGVNFEDWDR